MRAVALAVTVRRVPVGVAVGGATVGFAGLLREGFRGALVSEQLL